jgi:hypothetical protein
MVEQGKKSYRYLKLPEAQKTFAKASGILERTRPARCDPRVMADLYFYWARARLDSGDQDGASKLLSQIVRFDPRALPDPAIMAPNLVAAYDLALEELKTKPEIRVRVEAVPERGTLFVDCIQRPLPATIKGRAGEPFWLAAMTESGIYRGQFHYPNRSGRRLAVFSGKPGDGKRIRDAWGALSKAGVTLSTLQTTGNEQLDGMASTLGVNTLLVGEVRKGSGGNQLRLGLYLPGRGLTGSPQRVSLGAGGKPDAPKLASALGRLAATLKGPTVLAASEHAKEELTPPPPPDPVTDVGKPAPVLEAENEVKNGPTPWYESWWFWTIAGTVVAGGVTAGVLFATMDTGGSPSGRVILSIQPP